MTKINNSYSHFPMDFSYTQSHLDEKENVTKTSKETHQKSSNNPYDLDMTILNHGAFAPLQVTNSDTCQGTYGCNGTEGGTYGCSAGCPTQGSCTCQGTHGCY